MYDIIKIVLSFCYFQNLLKKIFLQLKMREIKKGFIKNKRFLLRFLLKTTKK